MTNNNLTVSLSLSSLPPTTRHPQICSKLLGDGRQCRPMRGEHLKRWWSLQSTFQTLKLSKWLLCALQIITLQPAPHIETEAWPASKSKYHHFLFPKFSGSYSQAKASLLLKLELYGKRSRCVIGKFLRHLNIWVFQGGKIWNITPLVLATGA